MVRAQASKYFCHACCSKRLSISRIRAGLEFCADCDAQVPKRVERIVMPLVVAAVGYPPSMLDDTLLGGKECDVSKRRPDCAWIASDRVVFVECDEKGGHPDRETLCELGKIWDHTAAVKKILGETTAVFVVRFNPDAWDGGRAGIEERAEAVGAEVVRLLELPRAELEARYDPRLPHVGYWYYHSSCQFQIDAALAQPDAVHVMEGSDDQAVPAGMLIEEEKK
jgi:hypothetical protein